MLLRATQVQTSLGLACFRLTSGFKTADQSLTIICSRLSSLVLYMMGKARPQDTSEMVRKINTAPRLLI